MLQPRYSPMSIDPWAVTFLYMHIHYVRCNCAHAVLYQSTTAGLCRHTQQSSPWDTPRFRLCHLRLRYYSRICQRQEMWMRFKEYTRRSRRRRKETYARSAGSVPGAQCVRCDRIKSKEAPVLHFSVTGYESGTDLERACMPSPSSLAPGLVLI